MAWITVAVVGMVLVYNGIRFLSMHLFGDETIPEGYCYGPALIGMFLVFLIGGLESQHLNWIVVNIYVAISIFMLSVFIGRILFAVIRLKTKNH